MTLSVPYSFVPGTKAKAGEVNANFNYVLGQVDETNSLKLNKDLSNITTSGVNFIKNSVSGKNIGEIVYSPIPIEDSGLHLLDGTKLRGDGVYSDFVNYIAELHSNSDYSGLFVTESSWQSSVTTYGACGKFVYDSENNTVRIPKISGITEATTNLSELGKLTVAGLPNITGFIDELCTYSSSSPTGAFYQSSSTAWKKSGVDQTLYEKDVYFDASRSSSIYGNSSTVQPQTIKLFIYIVVATAAKTDFEADIDGVVTDLNYKADTDLTNATNSAKILISNMAMPSAAYKDLTLGASYSNYTAPSNGWFSLMKRAINSGEWIQLGTNSNQISTRCYNAYTSSSGQSLRVFLPVKKGDTVNVGYTATSTTEYFRFIYAKGSESEAA